MKSENLRVIGPEIFKDIEKNFPWKFVLSKKIFFWTLDKFYQKILNLFNLTQYWSEKKNIHVFENLEKI